PHQFAERLDGLSERRPPRCGWNRERDRGRRRSKGQHAMMRESERTFCEPAAAWPARTFNHPIDVSGIAASAAHARPPASPESCPEVRVRAVTEPSPKAG